MGYNEDKAPDSRIAHIRKTSEAAKNEPDPIPCDECKGFGEIAVTDDDGKILGRRSCDKCEGTGAKL